MFLVKWSYFSFKKLHLELKSKCNSRNFLHPKKIPDVSLFPPPAPTSKKIIANNFATNTKSGKNFYRRLAAPKARRKKIRPKASVVDSLRRRPRTERPTFQRARAQAIKLSECQQQQHERARALQQRACARTSKNCS